MNSPRNGGLRKEYGEHRYSNRNRPDAHTLKAAIVPAEFYQYELPNMPVPKGGGWRDGGLCPFHADTRKGNFRVNVDSGAFRCFACNAKGGDAIAFTMQRYGLEFRSALRKLTEVWGVSYG